MYNEEVEIEYGNIPADDYAGSGHGRMFRG